MTGARDVPPIFLLGNPRSGTTMLRLVLTSHPEISIPPETEMIAKLFPRFGHVRAFDDAQLSAFTEAINGDTINLGEQWEVEFSDLMTASGPLGGYSYADACAAIYRGYQQAKGFSTKPIWGDKNNAYGNYIDVLTALYPEARFIHLVRDGRAVLNSYIGLNVSKDQKYAPLLPKQPREVAFRWIDTVERIERHLKRYAAGRHITLRYEDIVDDFRGTLSPLCDFLGVSFHEDMEQFHRINSEKSLEPRAYGWKSNTFRPLENKSKSKWQHSLSQSYINSFEEIAAPTLRRMGYEADARIKALPALDQLQFTANAWLRELLRAGRRLAVSLRTSPRQ